MAGSGARGRRLESGDVSEMFGIELDFTPVPKPVPVPKPEPEPVPGVDRRRRARERPIATPARTAGAASTATKKEEQPRGRFDILNQLHGHHGDFVIVGGVAAALHGGTRVTFGLDVVPALSRESSESASSRLAGLTDRGC